MARMQASILTGMLATTDGLCPFQIDHLAANLLATELLIFIDRDEKPPVLWTKQVRDGFVTKHLRLIRN